MVQLSGNTCALAKPSGVVFLQDSQSLDVGRWWCLSLCTSHCLHKLNGSNLNLKYTKDESCGRLVKMGLWAECGPLSDIKPLWENMKGLSHVPLWV